MAGIKRNRSESVDDNNRSDQVKKPKTTIKEEQDAGKIHKLIIGIDLGTTYSGMWERPICHGKHWSSTGVSWVSTNMKDIDDVHIIHVWPGTTATNWKTPTRIAYQRENKNMKKNTWGFKVQSEHISYSWTKLLLDKNANPGGYDDPALRKLTAGGMMKLPYFRDATGVCQDFLQEVCTWAFQTMRSAVGSATFDLTPKVKQPYIPLTMAT